MLEKYYCDGCEREFTSRADLESTRLGYKLAGFSFCRACRGEALIDPAVARAVSDLAREISAVGPLAMLVHASVGTTVLADRSINRAIYELCTYRAMLQLPILHKDTIATHLAALATRVGE